MNIGERDPHNSSKMDPQKMFKRKLRLYPNAAFACCGDMTSNKGKQKKLKKRKGK